MVDYPDDLHVEPSGDPDHIFLDRSNQYDGSINEVVDDVSFPANEIPHRTAGLENDVETSENYRNTLNTLSFFEYVIHLSTLEMTESISK